MLKYEGEKSVEKQNVIRYLAFEKYRFGHLQIMKKNYLIWNIF